MMDLNIIWLVKTELEIKFSFDWICELFSQYKIIHHYDIANDFKKFYRNSVLMVCVGRDNNTDLIEYINEYNKKKFNYVVFHLSDEAFEQNIDFYSVSKKIMRNYFNQVYVNNFNLLTIPLGYQTGIRYVETPKSFDINFVGQLKSDRHEMLSTFNAVPRKFFHLTRMWGDPTGLNTTQFSEVLSRSNFTLCPRGWIILDSFRINEALECKSIPVTILDFDGTDYFKNIYGEHPFIVGNNWQDAFQKMVNCEINTKLIEVNSWWGSYKESLKNKIKKFIDG